MSYQVDLFSRPLADGDAVVVASAPVLADLDAAIAGWGASAPAWGFASREGASSTFRFTRLEFNRSPSPGVLVSDPGPTGGQPLSGSASWTVTTFADAEPEVGDLLLVPLPGTNRWCLASVVGVPA